MECPFKHSKSEEEIERESSGKCPVDQGSLFKEESGGTKMVCPFAGAKSKINPFLCSICNSFYFEPLILEPCGHNFCQNCVSFVECPKDGFPVREKKRDQVLEKEMAEYVEAHSKSHLINEDNSVEKVSDPSKGESYNCGLFWFSLALRSFYGRNHEAALNRGEKAKQHLLENINETRQKGEGEVVEVASILAKIGDFNVSAKQFESSSKYYSLAEQILGEHKKALQNLSNEFVECENILTLKQGDLDYLRGKKQEALEKYSKVLSSRQSFFDENSSSINQVTLFFPSNSKKLDFF